MSQPSKLEHLKWDWSDAYSIEAVNGEFAAVRRDHPSVMLRADTVAELREKIVEDYATRAAPPEINGTSQ
jgi:hypothetical protein